MHKSRRVKITDLNPHITCVLCSGYLIEATTIIECLHSFCRTCIVKYLEHNKYCPICEVQVHKTKPLLNIRSDQTLQDIVYKLVPGLFQNEMCRRKDFYLKHPDQKPPDLEGRGEITQFSHIYTPDESISLSLEYYNNVSNENDNNDAETKKQEQGSRRYLRCPAAVSVAHLQKLIRAKYGLSNEHRVDILYKNDRLSEDFTLMDIAYIYLWRRKGPLHLTYRIFEVAKRIKLNDTLEDQEIKTEPLENDDTKVKNEWKEVQLQISENGVMSVTNIGETKTPETVRNFEVKTEVNLLNNKPIPELTPIEPKSEKAADEAIKIEKNKTSPQEIELGENETRLGKHKLQDDSFEKSAKIMKSNTTKTSVPVKNVQQLSRNHPLKIHSQSVNKNNIPVTTTITTTSLQMNSTLNVKTMQLKNQNTHHVQPLNKTVKSDVVKPVVVQKEQQQTAPTTVQSIQVVQSTPNTKILSNPTTTTTTTITTTSSQNAVSSATSSLAASITNVTGQNTLKYTQAGQSADNTRVTKSDDLIENCNQKTPISSSSVVPINNCIQSSKVGIVPKKSPVKIGSPMVYKTLRDPPKAWNPQISRQNLPTKTPIYPSNNGASTSDSKQRVETQSKPAKFFKMRNNVPRYLGNPASGVKPMYQVRDGDKSPPDANKKGETKKPENKLNNNNEVKAKPQTPEVEQKPKIEIKKQSIVKIDPKTLRPIVDKPPAQDIANPSPSCADTSAPEIKINQSTVPIFNPLRNQKSQTSPKIDRRSPKTATGYMDAPKSPMERNSPKMSGKMAANSPTSKKDKLSLNFTPPNPFIPNLASPNLNPNQFLYPNFPSYDPRVMNNLTAYHPFSMYYSQSRLTYPGLASQNLSIPQNLMSTLNLEVNKNLRKNYEMLQQQLSPSVDSKKSATCAKNPRENDEKTNVENSEKTKEVEITPKTTLDATKTITKQDTLKQAKQDTLKQAKQDTPKQDTLKQSKQDSLKQSKQETLKQSKQDTPKQLVVNHNDKDEIRLKTNEISNQLQKTNKEKELNALSKETPVECKEKEKSKSDVKKVEPVPIKVDKNESSKVELISTENKSKENDIVQNEKNAEKKIIKNDNKMETVKTT